MVTSWRVLAGRCWHGGLRPWMSNRYRHTIARSGLTWKMGLPWRGPWPHCCRGKWGWCSCGSLLEWSWSYVAEGLHMLRRGYGEERQGLDLGLLFSSQLVSPNSHLSLWQKTTKQPHAFVVNRSFFHFIQFARGTVKLVPCIRCGGMHYQMSYGHAVLKK